MEIETEEALNGRKADAEAEGDDDEDQKNRDSFKMSAEHLRMNQAFVIKRVLAALRRAPGMTLEHSMLLYEIVSTLSSLTSDKTGVKQLFTLLCRASRSDHHAWRVVALTAS